MPGSSPDPVPQQRRVELVALFRKVVVGAGMATLDIAGQMALPGAWPILRGALEPVLGRLSEKLGGDPIRSREAAERAADEFERDARLQDLLRTQLLKPLDELAKGQEKVDADVQALFVMVMENTRALDDLSHDVGDIRERLEHGMDLSPQAEERLVQLVAERVVVMQGVRDFAGRELTAVSADPSPPAAWLERDELVAQVNQSQHTAVEDVAAGRVAEAMDRLRHDRVLVGQALIETPTDSMLRVLNGYLLKTLAQAADGAGDREGAGDYLARAEEIFRLLVADAPADPIILAGAVNGLGNVHYARREYEKALECHAQATDVLPAYPEAWHDLFGTYDALALDGDLRIEGLERSYARLLEVAAANPAAAPSDLDDLRARLEEWRRSAAPSAG
jgi:tetratricopeptide (TPR) repeat protein